MLGILGGMGPLATVDFLAKLVAADEAETDQQHMPFIVRCVPQIPDRSRYITQGGENPLPALRQGLRELGRAGASVAAIPCNTAHYWYPDLVAPEMPEILHIVDAVAERLAAVLPEGGPIAILSTEGTHAARVYENRLDQVRWPIAEATGPERAAVGHGIALVKAGRIADARAIFSQAVESYCASGAKAIVLACTEIPAALSDPDPRVIDATQALALRCVRWFRESHRGFPPAATQSQRTAS